MRRSELFTIRHSEAFGARFCHTNAVLQALACYADRHAYLGELEPREIVQFDDPYRAGLWGGMDTDGKTLYFTINEWESDVWVTDLRKE